MTLKYGDKYTPYVKEFLLNVILVLNYARPAYRLNIPPLMRNDLIAMILSLYPDITVYSQYDEYEPLLFMTSSKHYIDNALIEYDHQGLATVLGYCYNGDDWNNLRIDRLSITPTASDHNSDITLFTTMIPKYAYQGKVVDCVLDQIALFNSILQDYGFKVTLSIELRPKKNI